MFHAAAIVADYIVDCIVCLMRMLLPIVREWVGGNATLKSKESYHENGEAHSNKVSTILSVIR